jgi:DNA gyrase/topoisomerase IV subunit B
MKELITEGHVYVGMPPLFKMEKKNEVHYAYTDADYNAKVKKYGSGFAILPGSIHELYLIKDTPECAAAWKEAVVCANTELVPPQDYLSDSVYYYNLDDETINILL